MGLDVFFFQKIRGSAKIGEYWWFKPEEVSVECKTHLCIQWHQHSLYSSWFNERQVPPQWKIQRYTATYFFFCFLPYIDACLNQIFFLCSLFLSHFTSPSFCLSLGGSLSASLEFYLSNLHPLWQPSVPPYNPLLLLQADLIKQSFSVMRKGAKGSASGWATIQRKLIVKKTGTHGHLLSVGCFVCVWAVQIWDSWWVGFLTQRALVYPWIKR